MDTKFELFDGGKYDTNAPPSYDAVSMSSISADSVQCRPPPVFSKEQTKQIRTTVLSLIRDMVSTLDFIPSTVGPIMDACAASLPAAEFTALLQESNIEGHTPLYWAVVNNRPEARLALYRFITRYTPDCFNDVRLACMATSDHAMFRMLKLTSVSCYSYKDGPLNQSLGCLPDEIQVYGEDTQGRFAAKMQIRMFQKRMRVAQKLCMELIAQGRIWCLLFYMGDDARWKVSLTLARHSLPARVKASLTVEAQKEQSQVLEMQFQSKEGFLLAPREYNNISIRTCASLTALLGDWLMFDDTIYTDSDGTLHVKLEVTLEEH